MRGLQVITEDGPGGVQLVDLPEPEGDLVIKVRAAGVAFPDLLMSRGEYQLRQPLPFTLGWEAAGDVVSASAESPFTVGDRVVTLTLGAHAERVAALPVMTFALPQGLSYEEGAALPLNYLTALAALERRGGLRAGESVLVHGAAGGVGSASVQLAKALGAARVVAVVSDEAKAEVARLAGADEVLVGDGFRAQLTAPIDLVVDPVGGQDRFTDSLRCLAPEGRLVVVGFAAGEIPQVKVNRLLLGNTDIRGCTFGVYALTESGLSEAMSRLAGLVADGGVRPIVGAVYPLSDASVALLAIAERRATGKVVLTLAPADMPQGSLGRTNTLRA